MSKARDLSDFISVATVDASEIADLAITHAKLHTDMNLSGKTVTLPSAITNTITNKLPLAGGTMTGILTGNRFINATNSSDPWIKGVNTSGVETSYIQQSGNAYFAGNVGIGTTSPSQKLHVDSGSTDTVALFESSGDANAYLVIKDSGSSGGAFIGAIGTHTILGTGGSTERVRINSAGNVGIGQTDPQGDLHIGNISGSKDIIMHATNNGNARIKFREGGSNASGFNEYSIGMVGSRNALTVEGQGAGEFLTLMGDTGNVGIGITVPDGKLTVALENSNTPAFRLSSPTSGTDFAISSYNDANGTYVSMGVNHLFNVSGNDAVMDTNDKSAAIVLDGRNNGRIQFLTNSSGIATPRMTILQDGKVGIGTIAPQVKLQVNDSGTTVPTSGYGTGFNVSRADGLIGMTMGYLSTNNTMYIQGRNFTNTDSQTISLNPNGGIIGIGTTVPYSGSKLTVQTDQSDAYAATGFNSDSLLRIVSVNADTNYSGIGFSNVGGNYEHFLGSVQTSANTADMVFQGYDRADNGYKEYLRIGDEGRVKFTQMPNFATRPHYTNVELGAGAVVSFYPPHVDNNNNFSGSTNRFTAPIAGAYRFDFHSNIWKNAVGIMYFNWFKNGVDTAGTQGGRIYGYYAGGWENMCGFVVLNLAVNDYVDLRAGGGGPKVDGGSYGQLTGYMLTST